MKAGMWRTVLVVGMPVAVLAGWMIWHQLRAESPGITASPEQDPFTIPVQTVLDEHQALPETPAESEAREQWLLALDAFRSARGMIDAARHTENLLEQIAAHWPDSAYAVRAQLFAINTLAIYYPELAAKERYEEAFVQRAQQFPGVYFTGEFQASTQWVIARQIERHLQAGDAAASWQACLRFRWIATQLDVLAPVCGRVVSRHPEVKLAPGQLLPLVPPQAKWVVLPAEKLKPAVRRARLAYLANPYDADALAGLVRKLHRAGISKPTDSLRAEVLELDSGKASWELENAIDAITAEMRQTP